MDIFNAYLENLGVVTLTADDGTPQSAHPVLNAAAFLSSLRYREGREHSFNFEAWTDLGIAVERCNEIVVKISDWRFASSDSASASEPSE